MYASPFIQWKLSKHFLSFMIVNIYVTFYRNKLYFDKLCQEPGSKSILRCYTG